MPEGTADPASYDVFAPFYDAFTAGSDYDAWAGHVLALADGYGLPAGSCSISRAERGTASCPSCVRASR